MVKISASCLTNFFRNSQKIQSYPLVLLVHVPVEGVVGGSVCTHLGAKTRPLYSYKVTFYIVRQGPRCTIWRPIRPLQMVDGKMVNINVYPPRNSINCITCSHRNNLTRDGAHSRDPCNISAERKGNRVKGLRDMRDTDLDKMKIFQTD